LAEDFAMPSKHPEKLPVDELLDGRSVAAVARQVASAEVSDDTGQSKDSIEGALRRLLHEGKTGWWEKPKRAPYRRELLRACPGLRALLPIEQQAVTYPVGDFPSVGDVQLTGTFPVLADCFDLMDRKLPAKAVWLEAPEGAGKTLHCRRLRARHSGFDVHTVETLADGAALPRGAAPLILDVQREGTEEEDADAANALLKRGFVRVLARFPPPPREFGWRSEGWTYLDWDPVPTWRTHYVAWAFHQAGQDALVDRALELFEELDPSGDWLNTPGLVQGLLATMVRGDRSEEVQETILKAAGVVLQQRARRASLAWCRAEGAEAVRDLARARIEEPGVPWEGPLHMDEGRESAMRSLAEEGLLREVGPGLLRCEPFWVWEAVGAQVLVDLVATGPIERWGRAGAGNLAEHLGHALSRLNDQAFWRLVEEVLGAWADTRSLAHASAVEACFSMAAKRGGKKTDRRAIRLWKAQRELLKRQWGKPVPSTRRGVGDGDFKAACAWVADCWDWSFEFSKPEDVHVSDLDPWLWPGWCWLKLEEMPDWLEDVGGPGLYDPGWPEGFQRMLGRAPQVTGRASGTPKEGRAGALTPQLAVEGRDSAALFKVVVQDSWLQDALVELLEKKGSDTRRAIANRMLDHLSQEWPLAVALARMKERVPYIWSAVSKVESPYERLRKPENVRELIAVTPPGVRAELFHQLAQHVDVADELSMSATADGAEALSVEVWHQALRHASRARGGHGAARAAWEADEKVTEELVRKEWATLGQLLWVTAPAEVKVRLVQAPELHALLSGGGVEVERDLRRLVRTNPAVAETAWRLLERATP